MTKTVDVEEAKSQLPELVSMALEGDEVIILEDNKPVARLVAIPQTGQQRVADLNKGEICMSDDFDEHLVSVTSPGRKRVMGLHRGVAWVSEDFDKPLPDEFWLGGDE